LIYVSIKKVNMSPRTEKVNQRIRDEQREKILTAARKVFAYKGFTATKMADIAAEAGVSYGLAYHYFANKEKIFSALVERAMEGAITVMQEALEGPGNPWERIRWMVTRVLNGLQHQPEYSMLVLQTLTTASVPQELRDLIQRQAVTHKKMICQLIVEGQAAGQVVQDDPERLATVYNACISGLAFDLLSEREQYLANFPDVDSVLRILKKESYHDNNIQKE
jgi:AcrR family transcriptional regulator